MSEGKRKKLFPIVVAFRSYTHVNLHVYYRSGTGSAFSKYLFSPSSCPISPLSILFSSINQGEDRDPFLDFHPLADSSRAIEKEGCEDHVSQGEQLIEIE